MITFDRQSFGQDLNNQADQLAPEALAALTQIKNKTCVGAEFTGWFNWPATYGFSLSKEIKSWRHSIDVDFDLIVVIGIGGSYLGTRAVSDITTHTFAGALSKEKTKTDGPMIVFAGHNMSETSLGDLLDFMTVRKPIVNVISKSGTTTEPSVAFRVIRDFMEKKFNKEASKRIIATTDAHTGALRRLASECDYKTFEVPSTVGGRYSVLTAVGLVPLALQGLDVEELLKGANRVFTDLMKPTPTEEGLLALQYAQCRTAAWKNHKNIEVLSYPEPKMRNLAEWWKQLFGESDGKDGKGLFPASLECTMDLHSLGQYLQEGVRSMMETFLSVDQPAKSSTSNQHGSLAVPRASSDLDELGYLEGRSIDMINQTALKATRLAHSAGGVPCLEIRSPDLSLNSLGALLAIFETACAVGGLMLNVNPFNQPGVEAYKLKMFELLGKPSK
jgi:glucose-6-phosphate isomerase